MKTKTLIFLLPKFSAGGAERIVITVANVLSERYEIYLAVIQAKGPLKAEVNSSVHIVDLGGKLAWPLLFIKLIRKQHPAAMMSTFWDLNLILVGLRFFFHKDTLLVFREAVIPHTVLERHPAKRLIYMLYRIAYQRADQVIALSENMKRSILMLAPGCASQISVINNAIDPKRLHSTLAKKIETPSKPYLIAVGRLTPQKGFDVLIEAFAKCQAEFPTLHLLIVGEGEQRAELEQLIHQWRLTSRVMLMGHISNPVPLIRQAQLYILSSRFEGMPNTLVESLCAGTPVLATARDTSAEEFIADGINGFLVDYCDAKLIANGLRTKITKLESIDRLKISNNACQQFSLDMMVTRYERILLGD